MFLQFSKVLVAIQYLNREVIEWLDVEIVTEQFNMLEKRVGFVKEKT